MINRRAILLAMTPVASSVSAAGPQITNIRFGIVREVGPKAFEFVQLTSRIPRRYKSSGFRFGIGFDNPARVMIEWYEQVHLPADLKEVSGELHRTRTRIMRTPTFKDDRPSVVDEFWFDEGDPLGPHRIELFVNGTLLAAFDFVVVEE